MSLIQRDDDHLYQEVSLQGLRQLRQQQYRDKMMELRRMPLQTRSPAVQLTRTNFGLWYVYPGSLHILTNATQIFIACVLILRFNPFRKTHLQPFDERMIFASAITLLVNAGVIVLHAS
jgi:hypothetical protein